MTEKVNKREQAFALFDEGKTPSSPEIKALKLKGNVKYNYYVRWREKVGAPAPPSKPESEAKVNGGPISERAMVAETEAVGEGGGDGKDGKGSDGKKPQRTIVAGQGLTFQIAISTKTLQLYQIAASMSEDELTIGDFVDTCVEDFFRGRGFDLGLIKIGGEAKNG